MKKQILSVFLLLVGCSPSSKNINFIGVASSLCVGNNGIILTTDGSSVSSIASPPGVVTTCCATSAGPPTGPSAVTIGSSTYSYWGPQSSTGTASSPATSSSGCPVALDSTYEANQFSRVQTTDQTAVTQLMCDLATYAQVSDLSTYCVPTNTNSGGASFGAGLSKGLTVVPPGPPPAGNLNGNNGANADAAALGGGGGGPPAGGGGGGGPGAAAAGSGGGAGGGSSGASTLGDASTSPAAADSSGLLGSVGDNSQTAGGYAGGAGAGESGDIVGWNNPFAAGSGAGGNNAGGTTSLGFGANLQGQGAQTDDPADYFTRIDIGEDIFKVVSRGIVGVAKKWK